MQGGRMSIQDCDQLVFFVNGRKIVEKNAQPEATLLQYLRNKLGLTGTKLGCAEGGCGACTVMISKYDRTNKQINHISVNACLAPLCSMHGLAVTTVEGIGSTKTRLHPVQERIAKSHGSQCGFCTPGMVMSMYTLLRNNPQPTTESMESAFEGNLCRCTGYRPIIDGFRSFTKEFQCQMGKDCCRNTTNGTPRVITNGGVVNNNTERSEDEKKLFDENGFTPYDPSQELIFPSHLQVSDEYDTRSVTFRSERVTWYRPVTLNEMLNLKFQSPTAKLVTGNTEVGVEVKFKNMKYPVVIATSCVPELHSVTHTDGGIKFGGSVTLSTIDVTLKRLIQKEPEHKTRVFAAIVEMLRWFAGHQVRNVSAVAGNIMTASPISDLNPLFLAAGCVLTVISKENGSRQLKMDGNFFPSYRKTAVRPEEILLDIEIPFSCQSEFFMGYKQAHRRDDDIAIVNGGFRVLFDEGSCIVKEVTMAFGGMAPMTVMPKKTMNRLIGLRWDDKLVSQACELLAEDLPLPAGTPGGMETYRRTLTTSFLFKFYLHVNQKLHEMGLLDDGVSKMDQSAIPLFSRPPSKGIQVFEEPSEEQAQNDPVGRSIAHLSAAKQATGEARYVDDMPQHSNGLFLGLVLSTKAKAKIVRVDPEVALKCPGVVDYIDHRDVPGNNVTGHIFPDEEIFASNQVVCTGQVIGAILAGTQHQAQLAAKEVKVTYEEQQPIITIEQAIKAESYHRSPQTLKKGDTVAGFLSSDQVLEGEVRIGGQEHFYMETMAAMVCPSGEDGEVEVFSSTQNPTASQMLISKALGVPANRVTLRAKRMGGGFGGKESRSVLLELPLAVAASKHNCPVRCMLDRDEDMLSTGTRHPFLGRYKVGFTNEGKILALELQLYSNAGCSVDLSVAVMERALLHSTNCYNVPNVDIIGYLCKTNLPTNTAFRGFGGPQGLFVCETWISDVSNRLGVSAEKIREVNLYHKGEITPYNQRLDDDNIWRCWEGVIEQSQLDQRVADIDAFNRSNRWKKRGVSVVPVKFGIAFTALFLNQAGALVHIYKDGSVLLTHGGTEMGQGLHTKMIQVASRVLGIPTDKIYISETSTNTVPNTSPTAASASSDLNGMAIVNACDALNKRLQPFKEAKPKDTWDQWVLAAYMSRVSLSSSGFYRTPGIGYDWEKNEGCAFNYFSIGAACTEVEIDCLTGDHVLLRTDIVMDVGQSLNPAIDIGQIEGAFTQGIGLFTLEEQRYSPDGVLYTRGPGFYKIPGFTDIPIQMNVTLLKGASNPKAVYSSKAIGEPPLFLAASTLFAIKNAIASARQDAGHSTSFRLDSPATCQKIRMACADQFTKQFPEAEEGTYKPWFVYL